MSSKALHKALIIIQTHINAQMEALNVGFAFVKENLEIIEISSVYLSYLEKTKMVNPRGQLVVAITVATTRSPLELHQLLEERTNTSKLSADYILALYEEETLLTPELTLPHPELHSSPHWLVPAAEIWGAGRHPILDVPLSEITDAKEGWGEFYAQGKVLLDFYYKQNK